MDGVSHNMYYIAGRIDDEERIRAIQQEVFAKTNAAPNNYKKRTPHVTFVNRIKLPITHETELNDEINQYNPSTIPIKVTGFSIWPSIDNPRYISLEVDAPISTYQDEFTNVINQYDGDILTEPPRPHITLCKCETPQEISHRMKEDLKKLEQEDIQFHTFIPYIDLLDEQMSSKDDFETKIPNQHLIQLND